MSNINPNNIVGNFPIAGQDNSSQGFRDNFTNIRNNFSRAALEITELQEKSVVTTPLSGSGSITNDFNGNPITNAQLRGISETILDKGYFSGTLQLNYTDANIFKLSTSGSVIFTTNSMSSTWPKSGIYGKVRLWLTVTDVAHTFTLPTSISGLADISGVDVNSGIVTFDTTGDYQFEIYTMDHGATLHILEISRNYASLRDNNLYYNHADNIDFNPSLFIGMGPSLEVFKSFEQGQDTVLALGSFASFAYGNLATASINDQNVYNDTDPTKFIPLSGLALGGLRGNLAQAPVSFLPAEPNDLLSFIGTYTLTGETGDPYNPLNYPQVSSVGFYVTGTETDGNGLGGNIAVYTKKDQGGELTQAIDIQNNQNVAFFGNIVMQNSTGWYPSNKNDVGTPGQMAWSRTSSTAGYLYICTATNEWQRVAIGNSGW